MCATKHERPLGIWRGRLLRTWYQQHPYPKIFVSHQAEQEFTAYYPNSGSSFAIPNGVWSETAQFPARVRSRYQQPFTLGFVGRLNYQKDPLLLAKTWVLVNQQLPCQLLIAGDGEMRAEVEAYLQLHAPDQSWQILGWLEQPRQLQAAYAKMDLLVMTSLFEAAPLVLAETAVLGIPIIAVRISQFLEFQSQVPLLQLVTERSPDSLSRAIICEYHQEQLLKAATPQALERIRDYFSLSRMAKLTTEAYHDAITNFH
jgi:glycosyltransferase involved in cell wall biosynthesis